MICVSLAEGSIEKVKAILKYVDFAELRLDAIEIDEAETKELVSTVSSKLIATCRPGRYDDAERIKLLKAAIKGGVNYIDIDIGNKAAFKKELIALAKKRSCNVILSYHNYECTPEIPELEEIVKKCFAGKADIAKIACMAKSQKDQEKVLSLYKNYKNLIAFCMGEHGKASRVDSYDLGAPFTYASISNDSKTAPGQIPYDRMKNLISKVNE